MRTHSHSTFRRFSGALLGAAVMLAAIPANAQVVISQPLSSTSGLNNDGQSFTPGIHTSGTFASSNAYLIQFAFVTSNTLNSTNAPVYLLIFSNFSSYVGSGLIQASTNTQAWQTLGTGATATFDFAGDVALDTGTKYYAVFSESPTMYAFPSGSAGRNVMWNSDAYSGGEMLSSGGEYGGTDVQFTATFATSAIPEPSAYAALFGLSAVGFAMWQKKARHRRTLF